MTQQWISEWGDPCSVFLTPCNVLDVMGGGMGGATICWLQSEWQKKISISVKYFNRSWNPAQSQIETILTFEIYFKKHFGTFPILFLAVREFLFFAFFLSVWNVLSTYLHHPGQTKASSISVTTTHTNTHTTLCCSQREARWWQDMHDRFCHGFICSTHLHLVSELREDSLDKEGEAGDVCKMGDCDTSVGNADWAGPRTMARLV